MLKMIKLISVLLLSPMTSSVKDSLSFFLTATLGVPKMPKFMGVVMVNNEPVGYYDSHTNVAVHKQTWVQEYLKKDRQHLEWYADQCRAHQSDFNADIYNLKRRSNQTGGVHILQRVSGCEVDKGTGAVSGFNRYGYNGEDFILLDMDTETWIAPQRAAELTKVRWDAEVATIQFMKHFYLNDCAQWIDNYMVYARKFLDRTVHPKVALLQKMPWSVVCCHATGFYPDHTAKMFWRKDGKEVRNHVAAGEILPNHDGTFQKSVYLNVSAVPEDEWAEYECVFYFDNGAQDEMVTALDKAVIKTNDLLPGSVFGGTVMVLLLLAAGVLVAGVLVACRFRRRKDSGIRLLPGQHTHAVQFDDS
ncbi:major histocompatibility complex class I-related gene protein-like isoform X2 [Phyllopteryx taeniolatus]|uniref:major histocompatibility complex class I-related gene protein-like isoform X2 n=1 Tax=Phyllopteryx taeniolatus TaxID=161469 RepID=UPI002AD2E35D|nr:major histocompatibility complex class I-related gene protein-like isoform X2 [Phyllopteryx taeniolatus]